MNRKKDLVDKSRFVMKRDLRPYNAFRHEAIDIFWKRKSSHHVGALESPFVSGHFPSVHELNRIRVKPFWRRKPLSNNAAVRISAQRGYR